MKLAVGYIYGELQVADQSDASVQVEDHLVYKPLYGYDSEITYIHLNNESNGIVVVNFFAEYLEARVRILPMNITLQPTEMVVYVGLKYDLRQDETIVARADTDGVVSYLLQGTIFPSIITSDVGDVP